MILHSWFVTIPCVALRILKFRIYVKIYLYTGCFMSLYHARTHILFLRVLIRNKVLALFQFLRRIPQRAEATATYFAQGSYGIFVPRSYWMRFNICPMQKKTGACITREYRSVGPGSIKRDGPHPVHGLDRAYPGHYCNRRGASDTTLTDPPRTLARCSSWRSHLSQCEFTELIRRRADITSRFPLVSYDQDGI